MALRVASSRNTDGASSITYATRELLGNFENIGMLHLLVTPLNGAFALVEVDGIAKLVRKHL